MARLALVALADAFSGLDEQAITDHGHFRILATFDGASTQGCLAACGSVSEALLATNRRVKLGFVHADHRDRLEDQYWRSVLVIDDKRLFAFDCAYARTVDQAISRLRDEWDEVWFDFDLALGENVVPILEWITTRVRKGQRPVIGEVVIHSSNPKGAGVVESVLRSHYSTRTVGPRELEELLARS